MAILNNRDFFLLILFSHFFLYLAVFGNFPVSRQVVGFLYLLFIPGIVLLRLFRFRNLTLSEKVVLSIGLNVSFLMLAGLAINSLAPVFGFNYPLSTNIIVVSISLVVIPLSLFGAGDPEFRLTVGGRDSFFCIAASAFLIFLGIYGLVVLNASGSSTILMLLILSISGVFFLASVSQKLIPLKFLPLLLIIACIALLLCVGNDTALVSNYLTGRGDQWIEFNAFRLTDIPSRWISTATSDAIRLIFFRLIQC